MFENDKILKMEISNSTAIQGFEYNKETMMLTIQFTSGGFYDYPNVPYQLVKDWMTAESVGRFFNQKIKRYSVA